MGAYRDRFLSTLQRIVSREEDDNLTVYEFRPFGQHGVRLFSINTVLPITYHPGLSVRDVCEKAADEVGILPINLPFFTLVTVEGGHVINLQKKLTEQECKEDYEFRMMFKGCHASRFADSGSYDESALTYLFHQCRHDFLMKTNCKIKFPRTENTDKKDNQNDIFFVRLVLSEITYQSRENSVKPTYILDNTRKYKIRHIFQRGLFSTFKFREVKNYLKKNLNKFEDLDETKLKREYVHYIETSEDYFVHKFHVNSIESNLVQNRSHNVPYELLISSKFGIKKKRFYEVKEKADQENAIVIVDNFEEVSMLEIDQLDNTKLTISRTTGSTQVFFTHTPQEAQSIAAIIDGYYKLLVNRYKVLINQGRTFPVKFHGSIARQRAVSKIQEYGTAEDGYFLLRQNRDFYHEYTLSLYYNKKCEHYRIKFCKENEEFYIEDTTRRFPDLKALIEYYKENKDGLVCCLSINCPPSDEGFDALLDNQSDVPTSDRPQDLSQFGLETIESKTIHELTEIGLGEFGSVIKAQWRRHEKENIIDVAIRKIKKSTYNDEFIRVGKKLIQLKNPNVIRCYGTVRMKNGIGLVMEYASQRLDDFLLQKVQCDNEFLTVKCIIQYAAQIAEGMMYLQEMDSIHGRLCAHTILVPKDPSNIKISDVGLLDLKQHGGQFFPGKVTQDRHCWHAPELLVNPDGLLTHESDAWSLGVTMWEMFTLKKPFYDSTGPLPREQILNLLTMRQKYLDTERKIIPRDVAGVIEHCWNRGPEGRISFRAVVLELRKSLLKKDSQESLDALVAPDKNYVESWEKKSIPADSKPTELLPATENNGYSILASEKSTGKSSTLFTGSPSNGTSSSCSNLQFVPRKESLHRTNSDPVSPTNIYDEPMMEKFRVLLTRTPSLSQLLSAPPTQTNHEDDKHVDNTCNNSHYISFVDDHVSEHAESHSTFAHDQNIESEKLQFEENNSPPDESQSTSHPHLSSVSSVEDRAMAYLQGLNSQQKITNSIPSPPASPPVCVPKDSCPYSIYKPHSPQEKQNEIASKQLMKKSELETDEQSDLETVPGAAMDFLADIIQKKKVEDTASSSNVKPVVALPPWKSTSNGSDLSDNNTSNIKLFHDDILQDFVNHHLNDSSGDEDESFTDDRPNLHIPDNTQHEMINNGTSTMTGNVPVSDSPTDTDNNSTHHHTTAIVDNNLQNFIMYHLHEDDIDSGCIGFNNTDTMPGTLAFSAPNLLQPSVSLDKDHIDYVKPGITQQVKGAAVQKADLVEDNPIPNSGYINPDAAVQKAALVEDNPIQNNGYINPDAAVQKAASVEDNPIPNSGYINPDSAVLKAASVEDNPIPNSGYINPDSAVQQNYLIKENTVLDADAERSPFLECPFTDDLPVTDGNDINEPTFGGWFCDYTNTVQADQDIQDRQQPITDTNQEDKNNAQKDHNMQYKQQPMPDTVQDNHNMQYKKQPMQDTVQEDHNMQYRQQPIQDTVQEDHNMQYRQQPMQDTVQEDHNMQYKQQPIQDTVQEDHNMQYRQQPMQDTVQEDHNMQYKQQPMQNTVQEDHNMQYRQQPMQDTVQEDHNMQYRQQPMQDTVQEDHNMQYRQQSMPDTVQEDQRTAQEDHNMQYKQQPIQDTVQEDHNMQYKQQPIQDIAQEDQRTAHKDQTMQYKQQPIPDTVQKRPDTILEDHHTPQNGQGNIDNHQTCEDQDGPAQHNLSMLAQSACSPQHSFDEGTEMTVIQPGAVSLPPTIQTTDNDVVMEEDTGSSPNIQDRQQPITDTIQEDKSIAQKYHNMQYKQRPDTTPHKDQANIDNHQTCEDQDGQAQHDLSMLAQSACSPQHSFDEGTEITVIQPDAVSLPPTIQTTDDDVAMEEDTGNVSTHTELMEEIRESNFIIPKQNLRCKGTLDSGNFGIVSKGVLLEIKRGSKVPKEKEVAIKELRKTADDKSREDFLKEAINMDKLAKIDNRNIIKFFGVCIEDSEDKIRIVTELAPLGNLKKYLKPFKGKESIKVSVLLDYCVQICSGMMELEKEDILHRDLALRNILVVTEDCVKISDFGLSRLSEYYRSEAPGKWPLKWYAPESIEFSKFTSKSDVWSFGVTMWEVFSYGDSPYPQIDTTKVIDYIKDGNRLPQPDGCPDDIYEEMNQCWLDDQKTRPSFYLLYNTLSALLKDKYREE